MHIISDMEFIQLLPYSPDTDSILPTIYISEGHLSEHFNNMQACYSEVQREISYLSNLTCYLMITHGEKIIYEKKADSNPIYLQTYILGWGLSMLAYQKKELAIHCSCISKQEGALLICGDSGCGKSTLTTDLLNKGYSLMADDLAMIHTIKGAPSYAYSAFPYQKLCRDAAINNDKAVENLLYINEAKDKFLVPYKGTFEKNPVVVRKMVLLSLSDDENVHCNEITGINKVHACMYSMFLKPLLRESLYESANVELCLNLASNISIYQISRPRNRNTREEIINEVLSIQ